MATSDPLLPVPKSRLLSSRAASRASHSAKPDEGRERATTAISGQKCLGLFGNFGRGGSSAKMLRDCLLSKPVWFSNQCALTWKEQVTPSKRLLYRLQPSARRIGEIGSGLLLTPTVVNAIERSDEALLKKSKKRAASGRITTPPGNLQEQMNAFQKTGSLTDMTALLPTATTRESEHPNMKITPDGRRAPTKGKTSFKIGLADTIALLPTPNASEAVKGREKSPSQMNRHTPGMGATVGNATGLKLQPNFVEWMMGYPQGYTSLVIIKNASITKNITLSKCRIPDIGLNG